MNSFRKIVNNPLKFKMFMLKKLPLAYVAGLRLREISDEKAVVSAKYKYITKNPFQSMYFAAQAMALEMSTGMLVLDKISTQDVRISSLVTDFKASFSKKAVGTILFTCNDGENLDAVLKRVANQEEGEIIELTSIGTDEQGDEVSRATIVWSVRAKRKKS